MPVPDPLPPRPGHLQGGGAAPHRGRLRACGGMSFRPRHLRRASLGAGYGREGSGPGNGRREGRGPLMTRKSLFASRWFREDRLPLLFNGVSALIVLGLIAASVSNYVAVAQAQHLTTLQTT